jgi:hypothetical protein
MGYSRFKYKKILPDLDYDKNASNGSMPFHRAAHFCWWKSYSRICLFPQANATRRLRVGGGRPGRQVGADCSRAHSPSKDGRPSGALRSAVDAVSDRVHSGPIRVRSAIAPTCSRPRLAAGRRRRPESWRRPSDSPTDISIPPPSSRERDSGHRAPVRRRESTHRR